MTEFATLTRIFHPIGHGAFYTENLHSNTNSFNDFNIIYDCGSLSPGPDFLKKYLKNNYFTMYPHKNIDALFISHFDNDHVNGLTYLLDNTTIKYIFLPQLTDDYIIQTFVYNLISTGIIDNIANRLICNDLLPSNEHDNPQIIKISHEESPDDIEINLDDNTSIPEIINTGTKLTKIIGSLKWLYIPYNLPINNNHYKINFKDYFKQELKISNELTIDNLFTEFKEIIQNSYKGKEANFLTKCREIYKNYFKILGKPQKHNFYSMPLFSGFETTSKNNIYPTIFTIPITYFDNPNYKYAFQYDYTLGNMIYMGDFYSNYNDPIGDTNTDKLIDFFEKKDLWDTIHNIQVPHHCSKYNFNKKLYKNKIWGIVSVSKKKRFGLPDIGTLAEIQSQNCIPLLVTEAPDSLRKFTYRFYH